MYEIKDETRKAFRSRYQYSKFNRNFSSTKQKTRGCMIDGFWIGASLNDFTTSHNRELVLSILNSYSVNSIWVLVIIHENINFKKFFKCIRSLKTALDTYRESRKTYSSLTTLHFVIDKFLFRVHYYPWQWYWILTNTYRVTASKTINHNEREKKMVRIKKNGSS